MVHRFSFIRICFYYLQMGGILMKPQDLTVLCCYAEREADILQIIQSSFGTFLRKELQNVEKHLSSIA